MKNGILLMLMVVAALVVPAAAQRVGIDLVEEYRYRGYDVYGDRVHTGVDTSIYGLDVGVLSHIGNQEDLKEWDTKLSHELVSIGGLDFRAGYGYFILPGVDVQEGSLTASLPGFITPSYTIVHAVPDDGDKGQFHVFGLDMYLGDGPKGVSALLSAELTYNDGVNPFGGDEVHDFTHVSAGLTLKLPLGDIALLPSLYYQHSFEKVVSEDDNKVWLGLRTEYLF